MGLVDLSDLPILGGDDLLNKYAIPGVMMRPVREMLTGILTLADGSRVRTIGYVSGQPMFATSNLVSERLGGRLVAQNLLTPEQQTEIDALMRQDGIRFGEAALQLKLMTKPELLPHIKSQQMAVIARVMSAESMQASFVACDVPEDLSNPLLLAAIEDGIREYKTLEIIDLLKEIEALVFSATHDDIELASKLGGSETLIRLLAALFDQPRRLSELLGADNDVPPAPAALTIVLCQLGQVVTAEAAVSRLLADESAVGRLFAAERPPLSVPPVEHSSDSSPVISDDTVASIVSALSEAAEEQAAGVTPAPAALPLPPPEESLLATIAQDIANDIGQDFAPDISAPSATVPPRPAVLAPVSPPEPEKKVVEPLRSVTASRPSLSMLRAPGVETPVAAIAPDKTKFRPSAWLGFAAGLLVGAGAYAVGERLIAKSDTVKTPASQPVVAASRPIETPASQAVSETTAPSAADNKAEDFYKTGNDNLKHKKLDDAIAAYRQALKLDPTMAVAHRALGIAYTTKGDESAAVKEYKAYIKLAPDAKDRAQVQALIDSMTE